VDQCSLFVSHLGLNRLLHKNGTNLALFSEEHVLGVLLENGILAGEAGLCGLDHVWRIVAEEHGEVGSCETVCEEIGVVTCPATYFQNTKFLEGTGLGEGGGIGRVV